MARLTTHVLDTTHGKPAVGIPVELYVLRGGGKRLVKSTVTGEDGRTTEPLLKGDTLEPGVYELNFLTGDYFRRQGIVLPDPPFLDEVVVRFGIAETTRHYHVPLLLSPYGYSTYRGS